jgi:hypothetical protein
VAFNGKVETRNALVQMFATNTLKGAYGKKNMVSKYSKLRKGEV